MTAPVRTNVRESLESVRYLVVQSLLVRVRLGVRFTDTLGDNLVIALLVASVFAVLALHACRVLEKVSAECAAHDIIELLLHKFMTILLMDLFFSLANSALSVQADVERSSVFGLFHYENVSNGSIPWKSIASPKLIASWIRPTGSRENQESI